MITNEERIAELERKVEQLERALTELSTGAVGVALDGEGAKCNDGETLMRLSRVKR